PNVSNTGAWSKYAAFGLGVDLPRNALPQKVTASVTGIAGYYWFGNQSPALGGFPLPAYVNWNAGVTFSRSIFNLDLRYYDTNLSKEDCFVFTGDPNAAAGGSIDPVRNPLGLMSRWCSATFVAKFWFPLQSVAPAAFSFAADHFNIPTTSARWKTGAIGARPKKRGAREVFHARSARPRRARRDDGAVRAACTGAGLSDPAGLHRGGSGSRHHGAPV